MRYISLILSPGQMTYIKMLSKRIIKRTFLPFTTLSWWGLSAFWCTPLNSPQHKKLDLNPSCRPTALQTVQSHLFPPGGEWLHAWEWPGITLWRSRWILTPSRSCEKPCSGKEQPYRPHLSLAFSFSLDKQNAACYSRHILPVAITSMGASAPRTVWCWVPPMGTGYRFPLPTMSVECKCLFKMLCSTIDFISFSLFLARLFLAQVKFLSIMRLSRWSQACCLSHKSRYYSIK